MWQVELINDWNFIQQKGFIQKWEMLIKQSPSSHVFFHPVLCNAWLDTYRPLRNLTPLIILAKSNNGKVAFLPLVEWKKNWKNAFSKTIVPIGYSDFDYHNPIFSDFMSSEEIADFWNIVFATLKKFHPDSIELEGITDEYCILGNFFNWNQCEICPALDLSNINSEEELFKFLKTSLRGDIRRQIRRINELGELNMQVYMNGTDIPDITFSRFMDCHTKRWPKSYKAPGFHRNLIKGIKEGSPIHFSVLRSGDIELAWHLGFQYNGVFYYYMPAGNPEYSRYSPVKVHLFNLILEAINNECYRFDHLRGEETYKDGWSDSVNHVNLAQWNSPSFSSRIKASLLTLKSRL